MAHTVHLCTDWPKQSFTKADRTTNISLVTYHLHHFFSEKHGPVIVWKVGPYIPTIAVSVFRLNKAKIIDILTV